MSATVDRIVSGQRDAPPATPIRPAPVFVWPPQPIALLRFLFGLPGYFLPLEHPVYGHGDPDLVRVHARPRAHGALSSGTGSRSSTAATSA